MPTTVRSYSKINLGLRIGPPRPDGFHELCTLYQTIGLFDELTVTAERGSVTEISLESNDPRVPTDSRNTVYKMISGALAAMDVEARVHVRLEKKLPVQGGLGAGSANAASALLGLERELDEALPGPARLELAERVGSDVPLFLLGGTVYGHNRGEMVEPYPDIPPTACVIVAPHVGSSTPAAFRAWDEHVAAALTPEAAQGRLNQLSRVYASAFAPAGSGMTGATGASRTPPVDDLQQSESLAGDPLPALVRTGLENDFQEVVFTQHPPLRDMLRALQGDESTSGEDRAVIASLSGSGSSLFGLFRSGDAAEAARLRVQGFPAAVFVTTTLPREIYWRNIFARSA